MFISRKDSDVCIAIIHKCGNSSIYDAVSFCNPCVEISNEDALNYKTRVVFLRDPIERINSAFNHFWQITHAGSSFGDMPKENLYLEGRGLQGDYESFIDYTFKIDNIHWTPQVEAVTLDNIFVPNKVHFLKNISKHWGDYYKIGNLPWANAWSKLDTKPYRVNELKDKYKKDYEVIKKWL